MEETYNMISVDGDTSTNDTVLLLANEMCIRDRQVLDIAKHGMHILQKAGEDSVALGTDFDGFEAGQNLSLIHI